MPEHAVEAIREVQTQENMVGMKLKESLNFVNDSFRPGRGA